MRCPSWMILVLTLAGLAGCEAPSMPYVLPQQRPLKAAMLYPHVPANTQMVWQVRSLRAPLGLLQDVSLLWPLVGSAPCEVWQKTLSVAGCTQSFWRASVISPRAPVLLFLHQGQWHMLGEKHQDFEARYQSWQAQHGPGSPGALTVVTDRVVHLALGTKGLPVEAGSWQTNPRNREAIKAMFLGEAPLAGVIDLPSLMAKLPATNPDAKRLRRAMTQEFGAVALKVYASGKKITSDWTLYARAQGARLEAAGPPNRAREPFRSDLGALIQPGILGVVRLSTNPRLLFQWWRATLSAADRLAMDEILERLKKEVALGIDEALFENLQGHAIAVFYGLESSALELDGPSLLGSLMSLDATQEVIYMPIEKKQPLEELLNAATQLSRGRLQQQRDKRVIQYAWFDQEDTLKWALMLHEDYVLFVDAPATFTHGVRHTRHPRPLDRAWAAGGLVDLLVPSPRRSGAFLDAQTLHQLLPAVGPSVLGKVDSVTLLSDEPTRPDSLYTLASWSVTVRLGAGWGQ